MKTMTCTQFRDTLDCYLDRELSPEATRAADRHRAECTPCDRLALDGLALRTAVRQAVAVHPLPAGLEARVRAATSRPPLARRAWVAGVAAVFVLGVLGAGVFHARVQRDAANAMDQMALRLEDSSEVVLHGTLLCRDCELEHRYGIKAPCKTIGHHGAIATPDGRIWNLVEQKAAAELIHDPQLLGRQITVRGRMFRGARALVIESYAFVAPPVAG